MECCCYSHNAQDLISNRKTSHERRFEEQIGGPSIPFGAKVEYHPISLQDQAKVPSVRDENILRHLYGLRSKCEGRSWKGDLLVADVEGSQGNDASDVYLRRVTTKEVLVSKERGHFILPFIDGSAQLAT